MLDANQLPILLGNGLDQPLLAAIVGALHTVFVPNKWPLFPLLRKLTRVDRFDIALMLLDASVCYNPQPPTPSRYHCLNVCVV
jgi:hypothetical protein